MTDAIILTEGQRYLIEKMGVSHEKHGTPPAPARILALLLISPDTELTFDQIRDTLNLSKSATSNALNMLLSKGKIDYMTKPGDRKRYFKNKIGSWKNELRISFQNIVKLADLFEEILEQRPENTPDFNHKLREIIDFMRFMEGKLPELYKEWESSKR